MKHYYDTGLLLKLYTQEPESSKVRAFVKKQGAVLRITDLHAVEMTSALRLKQFRRECNEGQVAAILSHLRQDERNGVLARVAVDWTDAWKICLQLTETHAAATGCRTLDTLHVACAALLGIECFASSDQRQIKMAKKAGLKVFNPAK